MSVCFSQGKKLLQIGAAVAVLVLASVTVPQSHAEDTSVVPDASFRACLSHQAGLPAGTDLSQYTADEQIVMLATVGSVNCFPGGDLPAGNPPVASIEGAQYLTNVTDFRVNRNAIADLGPLMQLAAQPNVLSVLDLSHNQISDVAALAGFRNIGTLYLTGNQISDVSPLAAMPKLATLTIGGNQIENIASIEGVVPFEPGVGLGQFTAVAQTASYSTAVGAWTLPVLAPLSIDPIASLAMSDGTSTTNLSPSTSTVTFPKAGTYTIVWISQIALDAGWDPANPLIPACAPTMDPAGVCGFSGTLTITVTAGQQPKIEPSAQPPTVWSETGGAVADGAGWAVPVAAALGVTVGGLLLAGTLRRRSSQHASAVC